MLVKLSTVIETISIEEITHYFICDEKINYLTDIHNYDFKNILREINNDVYPIIETIIVDMYHTLKESGELEGDSLQKDFKQLTVILEREKRIDRLFDQYPCAKTIIRKLIFDIVNELTEIFDRFEKDKNELSILLNDDLKMIKNIELSQGDRHDNRTVAKVTFSNNRALFYKPRNLKTDLIYNDYLSFYEQHSNIVFKKLKVLTRCAYAWQEAAEINQNLSLDEAKEYYYRAGFLLALFTIFRGTDIHFENIIVSDLCPVIIDSETMFSSAHFENLKTNNGKSINQSVLGTAMLPFKDQLYDINISGLFPKSEISKQLKVEILIEDETQGLKYESMAITSEIFPNAVLVDNKIIDYKLVMSDLEKGVREGLEIIANNKEHFLRIIQKYDSKCIKIRKLLRGTQVYYTFLNELKKPTALSDERVRDKILRILSKNFSPTNFGYLRVENEIFDLKQMNIPYFYTYLKDNDLYSRDKVICKNYHNITAWDNMKHAIEQLDQNMIDYQIHLLNLSLTVDNFSEDDINGSFNGEINKGEKIYKDLYPYELLKREVIIEDEKRSYIYMLGFNEKNLKITINDPGLYMGGGVLHYLGSYAYTQNDDEIKDFCKRMINQLFDQYQEQSSNGEKISYNVYQGFGGLVYICYNFYQYFDDEEIKNYTEKISKGMVNYLENSNRTNSDFDYINGDLSLIVLLIKLFSETTLRITNRKTMKSILRKYHELLRGENISEIGLAHGLSGVILTLSYMYKITEDKDILKFMYELVEKEDCLIDENTIDGSWCRGVGGILISRYTSLDNIKNSSDKKLKQKLQKTINKLNQKEYVDVFLDTNNICLCHGFAGTIDILAYISKISKNNHIEELKQLYIDGHDIKRFEWFKGSNYVLESFMLGATGSLYSLLHKQFDIPSVSGLNLFFKKSR